MAVSRRVRAAVVRLNRRLSDMVLTIRIDKSEFVVQSIENIERAAAYGMGLAAVVLVIFLRSFRSTIVIGISMPFSVMATFVLIYAHDFSLNVISFGGLALGLGLLVDNSIVVLESIYRRRDEGQPIKQAADRWDDRGGFGDRGEHDDHVDRVCAAGVCRGHDRCVAAPVVLGGLFCPDLFSAGQPDPDPDAGGSLGRTSEA